MGSSKKQKLHIILVTSVLFFKIKLCWSVNCNKSFKFNFADINQLMQSELELAQLRGHPGGIGQELPSQADSGVSSGDATTEGLSDKLKVRTLSDSTCTDLS